MKSLCGFNSDPGNVSSYFRIEGIENLLYFPICRIINFALKEKFLPNTLEIRGRFPSTNGEAGKQLRPISLTPCLLKVAEECVVRNYVNPAVQDVLDPSQFGAVPNSSTTQALIHMFYNKETDSNGATVRTIPFDYRKTHEFIDHL